jgi:hypothetical protein
MKTFYTFVMKGMFLCKHVRQDVLHVIVFLVTWVKEPIENNWTKLLRFMHYILAIDDNITKWEKKRTNREGNKPNKEKPFDCLTTTRSERVPRTKLQVCDNTARLCPNTSNQATSVLNQLS